jgi:hypothetical protein
MNRMDQARLDNLINALRQLRRALHDANVELGSGTPDSLQGAIGFLRFLISELAITSENLGKEGAQ